MSQPKTICGDCSCLHDGSTPGFEVGECDCHRIGGSFIQAVAHEFRPVEVPSDVGIHEPFSPCGRRWSDCDGSRKACHKRSVQ